MTEYAAYRAARAGIVNHGDCDIMKKAAFIAVLPTLGPPPSGGPGRVDTLNRAMDLYWTYTIDPRNQVYTPTALPRVRLEIVNPRKSQLASLFNNYGSHLNRQEIDYDDIRDATVIEGNLLSVRITYFYNMRIPFANWLMHSFFMGREYLGDLQGVQFEVQKAGRPVRHPVPGGSRGGQGRGLRPAAPAGQLGHLRDPADLHVLHAHAVQPPQQRHLRAGEVRGRLIRSTRDGARHVRHPSKNAP
jgi:hypothetical protein